MKKQEHKINHNTVEFLVFVVLLILLVQTFDEAIDKMDLIHQKLSKVYTRRTNGKTACLAFLIFYVLLRHTNIMKDKGFNPFDECVPRCVHLFPHLHLFFLRGQ